MSWLAAGRAESTRSIGWSISSMAATSWCYKLGITTNPEVASRSEYQYCSGMRRVPVARGCSQRTPRVWSGSSSWSRWRTTSLLGTLRSARGARAVDWGANSLPSRRAGPVRLAFGEHGSMPTVASGHSVGRDGCR